MFHSNTSQGVFSRARSFLFGDRAHTLRVETAGAHWLSYLLIAVQSLAVVLALGHNQISQLYSADLFIQTVAVATIFLLVATVFAADVALLQSLQRLPVLFRNKQSFALWEHALYALFVFVVEGSTLALVLYTMDVNPGALVSSAPLIPTTGALFFAAILGRAVLTIWTSVQLLIIRGKIAPQWSTLLATGLELVGGHAKAIMARLDMSSATLADVVAAYAAMSAPPARQRTWYNGWLVRRELDAAAREDAQRAAVVAALRGFDSRTQADSAPTRRGPTGGGTPLGMVADPSAPTSITAARATRGKRKKTRAVAADGRSDSEKQLAAFAAIEAADAAGRKLSNRQLAAAARVSISAASTYLREYPARRPSGSVAVQAQAEGAVI